MILSSIYMAMFLIVFGLIHSPIYDYVLFYVFWLVTLYVSYFVIKKAYPPSLQWDCVIWIAIMIAATFVIVSCTLQISIWIGWDIAGMMTPCGAGMKC